MIDEPKVFIMSIDRPKQAWIFFWAIVLPLSVAAQPKVVFGKVSIQELQMKTYEKDTSASAVILSDMGSLDGRELMFTRHVRVKILNKAGLEWGNWVINTPTKSNFTIYVFNLENGQVVKEKAPPSTIYSEEIIKGLVVYKVFAPNVRVGSVIDIKYTFVGLPFEWRFQDRIPVIFSQLTLEENSMIQYTKNSFGFHPIETVSENSWRAQDIPALKVEPFINNYSNYVSKFEFHLSSITLSGITALDHSSWKNIVNSLLESPRFGDALTNSRFLNDAAKEIMESSLSSKEKVTKAYEYIKKSMKWNGVKTIYVTPDLKKNFTENHLGNSAEINLSLVYLLNKIGIEANPIVLSTRDNGFLPEFFPSLEKLNYVIAMVILENKPLFLDATSEHIGLGFLPDYCINLRGLLVKQDNQQWFTLARKDYSESKKQFVTISMNGLAGKAKLIQDFGGVAFSNWISHLKEINFDSEVRTAEVSKGLNGAIVSNYETLLKEFSSGRGQESFEIDLSGAMVDTGEGFLLTPLFFLEYSSNPLKAEERKLPLDFVVGRELSATVIIGLPNGYRLEKVPESMKFSNADGSASCSFLVAASDKNLQYRITIKILRSIFTEAEYGELKEFFTQISKISNTPIEFRKI